jgi:hypothetical protein
MKNHRNWLTAAALILWLISLGCACVPEMERAPADGRLTSADSQAGKLNKTP